jgi:hypothetical protein
MTINLILSAFFFIWAGLVCGVSFVATPAKFLAPSLPMAQALDVGRWTFHVLALIEWGLVVLGGSLVAAAWQCRVQGGRLVIALFLLIASILVVETFWLRPLLDERVLKIIAGQHVAPTQQHSLYIALEAAKFALLLTAGVVSSRTVANLASAP